MTTLALENIGWLVFGFVVFALVARIMVANDFQD